MIDGMRQTGRTYRMMKEALKKAIEGNHVLIVAANQQQKDIMMKQYFIDWPGIYITFMSISELKNSRSLAGYPEAVVFIDHYAFEWDSQSLYKLQAEKNKKEQALSEIYQIAKNAL